MVHVPKLPFLGRVLHEDALNDFVGFSLGALGIIGGGDAEFSAVGHDDSWTVLLDVDVRVEVSDSGVGSDTSAARNPEKGLAVQFVNLLVVGLEKGVEVQRVDADGVDVAEVVLT